MPENRTRRHGPSPLWGVLSAGSGVLAGAVAGAVAGALVAGAAVQQAAPAGTTAEPATVQLAGAGAPAVPSGLPAGIEALAPYVKQTSCDPTAKPGVTSFGRLLQRTYPGTSYAISRACGADGIASEHYEGRALDWFVSVRDGSGRVRARALLDWLLATDSAGHTYANARRLGVMYVIWNNQIWGSYATSAGWRPYASCAAHPERSWDTACHRDHIHLSFSWAGARGRTSFWTRSVAGNDYGPCRPRDLNWAASTTRVNSRACPSYPAVQAPAGSSTTAQRLARYSGAELRRGSSGTIVATVQSALGATADGSFGPLTAEAVSRFRTGHGLRAGSTVDAATWRALLATYVTGRKTTSGSGGSGGSGSSGSTTSSGSPLTRYQGTVLRTGSRGAAVKAVQAALGVTADGIFGPITAGAVSRFRTGHGLRAGSTVDAATWKALIAAHTAGTSGTGSGSGSATRSTGPLSRYRGTVLYYGSRGNAVAAVQRALRVTPASGWFGPLTLRAVKDFQRAHGIRTTGNVGPLTWAALGS
ncbi:MAG: peptidoglycan-binding protein [Kineosporiaceae bacterium]